MKLIVGLGNPGRKYANTRHNIGFRVVERIAYKYNAKLKRKFLTKAKLMNLSIFGENIVVIEPQTYINLSGGCVLYFYNRLRLNLQDILIICDDINLPIGKIRIRPKGQSGGHNGLGSVINSLGSENFPRLRIGIKTARPVENLFEYVLSEFKDEEKRIIAQVIDYTVFACESWIKNGIEAAMNRFN